MDDQTDSTTPGIETEAIERWIREHVPSLTGPFVWTRLEGGHSNFTYRLDGTDGRGAVFRRPPLGTLLPKAHDMGREYRIISGLWPTPVPVAEPLGYEPDPSVTGAHFYVMGIVDGMALYSIDDVHHWVPEESRRQVGESFIDVLAALHSVDPDEVGLGELGRKEGYVARQLRTWYGSWEASKEPGRYDDPAIHELHDRLAASIPDQPPARVVHGDYGLHNVMIGSDHRVAAVLDWEISTLGDPLADLAYAINSWTEIDDPLRNKDDAPTLAPGFPGRDELLGRYADRTGADLSEIPYYRAFNSFKTACILHGVYARYVNGQKAIEPDELEEMRERLDRCVAQAKLSGEAV